MSLDKVTWAPAKKLPRRINKKAGVEIAPIRALVLHPKIAEPKPSTKGLARVRTITKSSGKASLERHCEKKTALAIKLFHNGF
jgi:hypothetical protein